MGECQFGDFFLWEIFLIRLKETFIASFDVRWNLQLDKHSRIGQKRSSVSQVLMSKSAGQMESEQDQGLKRCVPKRIRFQRGFHCGFHLFNRWIFKKTRLKGS